MQRRQLEHIVRAASGKSENTGGGVGLCLEVHDLAVSKLVAGREKDLAFVAGLMDNHLVDPAILGRRLADTPLSEDVRAICEGRLRRILQAP